MNAQQVFETKWGEFTLEKISFTWITKPPKLCYDTHYVCLSNCFPTFVFLYFQQATVISLSILDAQLYWQ
jgi:hypothetical protein